MMRPPLLASLALLFVIAAGVAHGAGECGRASADRVALRLAPCVSAADDPQSTPTSSCCSAVHAIGQSPSCLCAVMLSGTARAAGIKPEVAITIPKRCNMADRPVGYKCGGTRCLDDIVGNTVRVIDYDDKLMNARHARRCTCWKNRIR